MLFIIVNNYFDELLKVWMPSKHEGAKHPAHLGGDDRVDLPPAADQPSQLCQRQPDWYSCSLTGQGGC